MNMKLNHESESLVESEYIRVAQEISSKHYQAIHQFEQTMPRGGAMRAAIDNERIQMAKELVDTMLNIYLEAFRRENVIPDDSYVASIYSRFESIVDNISRSSRPPHLPSSLEKYRSIAPSAGQDLVLAVKKMRLERQRSESRDSDGLHITMGDTYNIIGQAGSVGPNAQAVGNTFNQGAGIASINSDVISIQNTQSKLSDMDKELLQLLKKELPSQGRAMKFLRLHDIGSSFYISELDEIDHFISTWHDAEHEFQHPEMQKRLKDLHTAANDFRYNLSLNIFESHKRDGWFSMELDDFEMRPEKLKLREDLNEQATKVYEMYQDLIRIGRKLQ
jgi:hypothetical protein